MFAVVHHNGNNKYLRALFDNKESAEDWIANLRVNQEWERSAFHVYELPVNGTIGQLLEV